MERITRLNPLFEILKSSPERVNKILIHKEMGPQRRSFIIAEARRHGIPCLLVPKNKLDRLAARHQGLIAEVASKEFSPLDEILETSGKLFVVLLDGIEDPQNLGAVIRSAEAAGADGLVVPQRRSAGLSETVATVSAGALEHLKVARVTNLARTMDTLKEQNIWLVGAEGAGEELWFDFDYTLPVGIVLGSEGKGLRPLVRKKCDKILSIPLPGRVNSLNVAAAAAVFFFEVVRQRAGRGDS